MKRVLSLIVALLAYAGLAFGAVNINTATQQELESLDGIGPVKAKAIVDYRAKNGPFRSLDDVKKVSGIKDATFDKMKGDITLTGPTTTAAKPDAKAEKAAQARSKEAASEKKAEAEHKATNAKAEGKAKAAEAKAEGKKEATETKAAGKEKAADAKADARKAKAEAAQKAKEEKAEAKKKAREAKAEAKKKAAEAKADAKDAKKDDKDTGKK